jgi:hypothetical protein
MKLKVSFIHRRLFELSVSEKVYFVVRCINHLIFIQINSTPNNELNTILCRLTMNGGAAPFPVMGASKAAPHQPARHYYFSKHKKSDKKRLTKVQPPKPRQ